MQWTCKMEENENNYMKSHEVQNSQDTSEQNNNNDDMEESDDQSQEEETNKFLHLIYGVFKKFSSQTLIYI